MDLVGERGDLGAGMMETPPRMTCMWSWSLSPSRASSRSSTLPGMATCNSLSDGAAERMVLPQPVAVACYSWLSDRGGGGMEDLHVLWLVEAGGAGVGGAGVGGVGHHGPPVVALGRLAHRVRATVLLVIRVPAEGRSGGRSDMPLGFEMVQM